MLHFEMESSQDGTKCSAGSATLNRRVSVPGCRCADCDLARTSPAPKHTSRPNSVSLMENQRSFENGVKIDDVDSLLKGVGDDTAFVDGAYVRFAKSEADLSPVAVRHEYCYPAVESDSGTRKAPPSGRLDVVPPRSRLPVDIKNSLSAAGVRRTHPQVRCIYCCKPFDPEVGKDRHMCREAPDRVMDLIEFATCACVADTVAYHCFADSEGEFEPACMCSGLSRRSLIKWTVVVLMSVLLPCLCCFWPLVGCRRCAMRCGCCVPRHVAA